MNPSSNALTARPPYDVLVVGGGPAGFAASVAAGRMGCRVLLVERHPVLGGMGTAALVNNFCSAHFDGHRFIIGGIFGELRQRLIDRRALYARPPDRNMMEPYHPGAYADELRAMCKAAGVELALGKTLDGLACDDAGAAFKVGSHALRAAAVVDASGDAVGAHCAGAPFQQGFPERPVMPLTFCYKLGPIDLDAAERGFPETVHTDPVTGERFFRFGGYHPEVDRWIREDRAAGLLNIPRDHISAIVSVPLEPEYATVNYGRVQCADPTDPDQLERAEVEGRAQIESGVAFFRRHFPGLENVEVVEFARQIGVRQSRQLKGLYTLTGADARACLQFDDCIAQCRYSIDIHEPGKDSTVLIPFAPGTHYDIPWRCLVPASGPGNLIVAGRCISADTEAMSSFRVAPSVMAIGEAAGVGAALAVQRGCMLRDVPAAAVQARLLETGGILS